MTDYENDLAFKPALSWEEFCDSVRDKADYIGDDYVNACKCSIEFRKDNIVIINDEYFYNVSYERMKKIIDALEEEE